MNQDSLGHGGPFYLGETMQHYKLDGRKVVPCNLEESIEQWAKRELELKKSGKDPWSICCTKIVEMTVSTVFLGEDCTFSVESPMLFETLIFESNCDTFYQARYATWEEAELGHRTAVKVLTRIVNERN